MSTILPGPLASAIDEDAAERPDVRALVDSSAFGLLRRHKSCGSQNYAGLRHLIGERR